jgi:hypothetical protein
LEEGSLALEWSEVDDEVVAAAPATFVLVVVVAADFVAVWLSRLDGAALAGGTLSAGRLDPMLVVAADGVAELTSDAGSVEVVPAAALLAAEAAVVVAVETAAFVVFATVETAFVAVVAAVETAFVVVAATVETAFVAFVAVDLAIATVDATGFATGTPANRAAHDCAGENAAAIKMPAAMGPANHFVLPCLIGTPQGRVFLVGGWSTPNRWSYSWMRPACASAAARTACVLNGALAAERLATYSTGPQPMNVWRPGAAHRTLLLALVLNLDSVVLIGARAIYLSGLTPEPSV